MASLSPPPPPPPQGKGGRRRQQRQHRPRKVEASEKPAGFLVAGVPHLHFWSQVSGCACADPRGGGRRALPHPQTHRHHASGWSDLKWLKQRVMHEGPARPVCWWCHLCGVSAEVEVCEHEPAVRVQQDVARLDVLVNDAAVVQVHHGAQQLPRDRLTDEEAIEPQQSGIRARRRPCLPSVLVAGLPACLPRPDGLSYPPAGPRALWARRPAKC